MTDDAFCAEGVQMGQLTLDDKHRELEETIEQNPALYEVFAEYRAIYEKYNTIQIMLAEEYQVCCDEIQQRVGYLRFKAAEMLFKDDLQAKDQFSQGCKAIIGGIQQTAELSNAMRLYKEKLKQFLGGASGLF